MEFRIYKDIKEFYKDTYDILLRHEGQNLIPLGNIIIGNEGKDKHDWRDPLNWFMATVSGENGIILTAIMTPPWNLTLYATDNRLNNRALDFLVNEIIKENISVPGVMSEKSLAEGFASKYTLAKGMEFSVSMNQRIYELTEVNHDIPEIGSLRLAKESDISFFPYWFEGFRLECFDTPIAINSDEEVYRYHIATDKLYILEYNGMPVSMAKTAREMTTVCSVAVVYTPPYFRGKGYATSCVAKVSRMVLGRGFKKCVLYTDLANPTSNSIYQKIGYRPICDSLDIKFE